jgi:glucose-1-phosphate thymidylyltransferase
MRGILLAGGTGLRLYPITKGVSKQLLPVYDKPLIYYPLSVLMLAKIKDILIITNKEYINNYKNLLGNGKKFGINLSYKIQKKPRGIADAFIIGKKFIQNQKVCLVLGDNIFYGQGFVEKINQAKNIKTGATIFAYQVRDPENFGVVSFNKDKIATSIVEKPNKPKSNFAVTGLYFYDNSVLEIAKKIKPSKRGELEISSINNEYLKKKKLNVQIFGRGFAWLDTGTHKNLLEASNFVQTIENRQGLKIACLEEIAFKNKWISKTEVKNVIKKLSNNEYAKYLSLIIKESN